MYADDIGLRADKCQKQPVDKVQFPLGLGVYQERRLSWKHAYRRFQLDRS